MTSHYRIKEVPDASLGRHGFEIISAGGIVTARVFGEEHREHAQGLLDAMNGGAVAGGSLTLQLGPHPHPALSMTRYAGSADRWFWSITMPDGHPHRVQGGFGSAVACAADLAETGVPMLAQAEAMMARMNDNNKRSTTP